MADDEKVKVQTYVDPETKQFIESMQRGSQRTNEIWNMSESECLRELAHYGIKKLPDDLKECPEKIPPELIDEAVREKWRAEQNHKQQIEAGDVLYQRGGWRGQVRNRVRGMLLGQDPFDVDTVDALKHRFLSEIEGYERAAEKVEEFDPDKDLEERLEAHEEWLDNLLEEYEMSLTAKEHVPESTFAEADDAVAVGADIHRLREQSDKVVSDLVDEIDADNIYADPDAIAGKLATEWTVSEETVWLLIDNLTPESVPNRSVFSGVDETDIDDIPTLIDTEQTDILDVDVDIDDLASDQRRRQESDDDDGELPGESADDRDGDGASEETSSDAPDATPTVETPADDYPGIDSDGMATTEAVVSDGMGVESDPSDAQIRRAMQLVVDGKDEEEITDEISGKTEDVQAAHTEAMHRVKETELDDDLVKSMLEAKREHGSWQVAEDLHPERGLVEKAKAQRVAAALYKDRDEYESILDGMVPLEEADYSGELAPDDGDSQEVMADDD